MSLLTVLSDKKDRWGETRLTMDELSEMTGMSRTTLWRALTVLTDRGLVETTRTKRNLGRLYKNRYKVLNFETSTADQGNNNDYINQSTKLVIVKNTSYSFRADGAGKEIMVNKWKEEDEDQMSFGLLDEPTISTEKVSKADPKTRFVRPQAEWTAMDVACEFASRLYDNVRGVPNLVNTMKLRGVLAMNRKKYDITAEHELAIIEKFFGDQRNINLIKKSPRNTIGIFLAYFTNNIGSIRTEVTIGSAIELAESIEYLYASDGTRFDKSLSGRANLDYYEKKLKNG
jgi:DNA-binding Lrp family transcriptional regulator